jgi:ferredoxin
MALSGPARSSKVQSRPWRTLCRCVVLAAAVGLAWPGRVDSPGSVILPALSPFLAGASALAARSLGWMILLALPVLVLSLCFRRWFCRNACPTGFLQEILQQCRPGAPRAWRRVPEIGRWLVLMTLGGACLGYSLFLWLDPLALFNGFLNGWRPPLTALGVLAAAGLPALLVLDFVFPGLWCKRLCPLGATQEFLAWPRQRWGRWRSALPPDSTAWQGPKLARRSFLGGGAGALTALWVNRVRGAGSPPRPPGALAEAQFTGVCVRCGNCAQSCPPRIIQPDLRPGDPAAWLTPRLSFESDYCREDCHRCGLVCPSGAIRRLRLPDKRRRVIGPARVDLDACLLAQGRECTACIRACPYGAILTRTSEDGFANEPQVDLAKCTGCGACEAICPVRPARAICVVASPGRLA